MQLEKKTATHKIFKRKDGRFAVVTKKGNAVNAEEKIEILIAEGLVTKPEPKAEPEVAEEAPAEETTEEGAE